MSIAKSVTKLWWGWNPEKIENWLEQMEAEGWHLYSVTGIGIKFHFAKGEPRKIRYCADYQMNIKPEYKLIFMDAGWELVYEGGGWYIWRMEYEGERPEIFTDVASLLHRNQRILALFSIIAVIQLPGISTFVLHGTDGSVSAEMLIIYGVLFSLIGYGIYKLMESSKLIREREKYRQ
jgi:nicotinamide riboside transporter PnuC